MKQNDITDIDIKQLQPQHFENIFNVYETEDELYYYNLLKTVNFPEDLNPLYYDYYQIVPKDTWPLISWKIYKSVKLWWILCSLNGVLDPLTPLTPPYVVKFLRPDLIKEVLAEIRNK